MWVKSKYDDSLINLNLVKRISYGASRTENNRWYVCCDDIIYSKHTSMEAAKDAFTELEIKYIEVKN